MFYNKQITLKISLLPSLHCLTFTFISIGLYQRPTASNLLFEHLHAIPLHYVLKSMILQFLTVHKSYRQFHICVVFFLYLESALKNEAEDPSKFWYRPIELLCVTSQKIIILIFLVVRKLKCLSWFISRRI